MEQTTDAEAIEAEKRETSLRKLVADLQKTNHSTTEGASEQMKTLEVYFLLINCTFVFSYEFLI